jgi:hypothetical protein
MKAWTESAVASSSHVLLALARRPITREREPASMSK